jgi:hypothetical protein
MAIRKPLEAHCNNCNLATAGVTAVPVLGSPTTAFAVIGFVQSAISGTAAANSAQFGLLITCVAWAVVWTVVTRARLSYHGIGTRLKAPTPRPRGWLLRRESA